MKRLLAHAGVTRPRDWRDALRQARYASYQLGTYLLLNVVEDPAWLAWAFC
jgi:hypothetical protein